MFDKPEFKVGSLALISFLLLGYMSMKVATGVSFFSSTEKHQLEVNDATGIIPNTAVKIAGVKVGVVDLIELKAGKAIITLSIQKDLGLSRSSYAEFKTDGILGTKHIAIYDSKPSEEPLKPGDQLGMVMSSSSMGSVLKQVGDAAQSLQDVAQAFREATVSGTNATPIGRILKNIESLTSDLAEVSSINKDRVGSILSKLDGIATTLEGVLGAGQRNQFNEAFGHAYNGLARFDEAIGNIKEITEKVNDGEGSIGKLINDEETVDGINQVVDNLNSILGGARVLRTSFDYHSEYLTNEGDVKSFVGLRLQPGADRYYELAVVQDPFGVESKRTVLTEGTQTEDFEETITRKNKFKVTALFAKNFYDFTLKGGLIESSGGFGVDYLTLNKKLRLSAEVFDFDETNLRVFARYNMYSGLYVVGGYNSVLGDEEAISSPFIGAGLFLRNDDLATMASFVLRR